VAALLVAVLLIELRRAINFFAETVPNTTTRTVFLQSRAG
jgi:hypothetical protein